MGRLSGFTYLEATRRLRQLGLEFYRQAAGSHEIWRHSERKKLVTIPRHSREIPEGTLRAILRQAGIDPEEFLRA